MSEQRDRLLLRYYASFHGRVPTLADSLRQPAGFWLKQGLLLAAVLGFAAWRRDAYAALLVGMYLGQFPTLLGLAAAMRRNWPLLDRIIDWPRVHAELEAGARPPAAARR